MLSYGLPLLGLLGARGARGSARSWRPLPVAALAAAGGRAGASPPLGFAWWEAYPVLHERYWDGIASNRPAAYWMWGNLAALLFCAGPLLAAGVAHAWPGAATRRTRPGVRSRSLVARRRGHGRWPPTCRG